MFFYRASCYRRFFFNYSLIFALLLLYRGFLRIYGKFEHAECRDVYNEISRVFYNVIVTD